MMFQRFTFAEVETIFRASEGRAVTRGRANPGHAGERHVSISNAGLWDRFMDYQDSGLALRTAFLDFKSQVGAALAVLNDPANETELERFATQTRQDAPPFALKNAWLPAPVTMRYAIGGGAQTFPCHYFTLVLRKDLSRVRQMHIVTFFGTMGPF